MLEVENDTVTRVRRAVRNLLADPGAGPSGRLLDLVASAPESARSLAIDDINVFLANEQGSVDRAIIDTLVKLRRA